MKKETKIKIGEKEYKVKKSYRALLEFEEMTKKSITEIGKTLKDLLVFFYCVVEANNDVYFDFNGFLSLLDEYPESVDAFNDFIIESAEEEVNEDKKKE